MKKIFTLITFFLPLLALAQPTIQQSDLPYAGVAWITASNANYSGSIPAGGANQTWDYTSLADSSTDTTAFFPVAGTPYVDSFPTANCAGYDAFSGAWSYYTSNSSGLYFDGTTGSPFFIFNPPALYVPVPFTYLNSTSSTAHAEFDALYDTIQARVSYYITSSIVADGWGTLKIPTGTYPNTLREKATTTNSDSIFADLLHTGHYTFLTKSVSQTVTYRWVRNGVPGATYLLGIDADSAGTTATNSEYYLSNFTLSTNNLSAVSNALHVYPNPASGIVHFDLQASKGGNAVLKVYNTLGEQIISGELQGFNHFDLPVDKLSNGIYFYTLISDGEKQSGKFHDLTLLV